jgi:hypothetical protein
MLSGWKNRVGRVSYHAIFFWPELKSMSLSPSERLNIGGPGGVSDHNWFGHKVNTGQLMLVLNIELTKWLADIEFIADTFSKN